MLHLVLEDSEVRIEPEFRLYEEAFLNVFELILSSAHMVPRVDSLLLPHWVRRKLNTQKRCFCCTVEIPQLRQDEAFVPVFFFLHLYITFFTDRPQL